MRALVVYESMFGNTEEVAKAVAEGLSAHLPVDLTEVGAAPALVDPDIGLLVVGGPTHALGLSRPSTRQDAAKQAGHDLVSAGIGLREWLAAMPAGSDSIAVTAFDTRISKPRIPGSAARAAVRRLRRLGFRVVAPAKSFYVAGSSGPLVTGEPDRARRWGDELGSEVSSRISR